MAERKGSSQKKQYKTIHIADALRENEPLLQFFLENAPDGIFLCDLHGTFIFGNRQCEKISGRRREDMIGKNYLETGLIAESSLKKVVRALRAANKGLVVHTYEAELVNGNDGRITPVEVTSSMVRYSGQDAILGFLRDISERKKTEQALKDSEQRYRDFFNKLLLPLFETDRKGKVTAGNPALLEIYGYSPEDLERGVNIFMCVAPEQRKMMQTNMRRVLKGEKKDASEYVAVRKDGSTFPILAFASPIVREGFTAGISGAVIDLTVRKRMEEALRDSEEKYRTLVNSIPDIIYSLDAGGNILSMNENVLSRYGYNSETVLGTPFLDFIHSDDREKIVLSFLQAVEDHREYTKGLEFRFLAGDGSVHWGELHSHMNFDDRGQYFREEGILRDITDRKQAEEEKQKLQEHLARAQKMESIGTLAGGIAHDFNNLLMTVQAHVSLMRQGMDPSHPDFGRLMLIDEQVDSGAALTRQLLGFARGGKNEISHRNMNAVVEKAAAMFGRTRKELSIRKKFADDLWMAEVDLGQMEQMLLNLFVNAWHAIPGCGEILLATENFLLTETEAFPYTVKPGRYVKITVADTGVGMDAKTREQIFDPFFTTKMMGRGTGLGLAMVYGIVKGHGGMIDVDSEPGRGTMFTIYLPASSGEETVGKPVLAKLVLGTETILLVDDEESVLSVNKEMLEFMGYRVLIAGSGQEAIAVYIEKGAGIDLVILDLIMPGLSGAETYDQLKKINPDVRVLLASGYNVGTQSMRILENGCNGFLQKPFRLETLSQRVREVLDRFL